MFTSNTQGAANLPAPGRAGDLVAHLLASYTRHRAGRTTAQAFAQETASPLRELRKLVKKKPVVDEKPTIAIVRRIIEKDGTLSAPFVMRPAPTPGHPYAQERVPWTEPEEEAQVDVAPMLTGDVLALLEADLTTRAVRGSVTKTAARTEAQVLEGLREGLRLTAPPLGVNTRLAIRMRIPFPPNA